MHRAPDNFHPLAFTGPEKRSTKTKHRQVTQDAPSSLVPLGYWRFDKLHWQNLRLIPMGIPGTPEIAKPLCPTSLSKSDCPGDQAATLHSAPPCPSVSPQFPPNLSASAPRPHDAQMLSPASSYRSPPRLHYCSRVDLPLACSPSRHNAIYHVAIQIP